MIIDLIEKHPKLALVCTCFEHISHLLDLCKDSNITFSKRLGVTDIYTETWEGLYEKYTKHLSSDHKSVVLIIVGDLGDINIFTRSYKDWGKYDDWENYYFIDYSAHIREDKINELVNF